MLEAITILAAIATISGAVYAALQYHRKPKSEQKEPPITSIKGKTIPQQSSHFVGRKDELSEVLRKLESRSFLVEIIGIGGIGKTALAIAVANHCIKEKIYEEVVWTSAKYQPISLEIMVRDILSAIYGRTEYNVTSSEAIELSKRALGKSKVLVIIDNFEEVQDRRIYSFLEYLPSPSKSLITTRHSKIKAAMAIRLKGLPLPDSLTLAKKEIERLPIESLLTASDNHLLKICNLSHGIPFIIKWILGQIKSGQDYDTLLHGIETAGLAAEEMYDYMFSKSFSEIDKTLLAIILALALFNNTVIFDDAVLVTYPDKPDLVSRGLAQLVDLSLLETEFSNENNKTLYLLHPLTRKYLLQMIRVQPELNAFEERFYSKIYDSAIENGRTGEPVYSFLDRNLQTVLNTIDWLIQKMKWEAVVNMQQAISRFLWVRGHWIQRVNYGNKALEAARLIPNKQAEASILMDDLGWTTYALYKDSSSAYDYLDNAKKIFDVIKDPFCQAKVRRHLAAIARNSGELEKVSELYSEALDFSKNIIEQKKSHEMEASIHVSLGKLDRETNDWQLALGHYDNAINLFKNINDSLRLVKVFNLKAEALINLDDIDKATVLLNSVLEQSQKLGRLDQYATALELYALLNKKKGDENKANKAAREAARAYGSLGDNSSIKRLKDQWATAFKDFKEL